ncbi:MAG: 50S ribosomal protein L22 [Acidimicrobiaceae bacterium TMED77]|nr:MAG: 50S ribosomal protein L22 [Acidimicrobiaceae bacterium TMED77]|tara:strand:- start:61535 stop:62392 length:858 start_codon:yes stop_codon:yes gene_type:complete
MTATKTNERPGTRAQIKYVRSSAYKVREVLNLIRTKSFSEATDILMFSERRISDTVQKCLNSAAANAENNDNISSEELYVSACYADEGPTLKRWRPRARGRATRIRKRTCHITIILSRYTPEELEAMREQSSLKGSGSQESASESRKRRVQKSKETHSEEEVAAEEVEAEEVAAEEVEAEEVEAEDSETNEPDSGPFGEGSATALEDGSAPGSEYIIKGKTSTKIYHPEESSFYGRTKADVWFTNSETAENAGFRLPNSMQKGSEEITEESEMEKHDDGNDEENA